jgi:hypothetical protein
MILLREYIDIFTNRPMQMLYSAKVLEPSTPSTHQTKRVDALEVSMPLPLKNIDQQPPYSEKDELFTRHVEDPRERAEIRMHAPNPAITLTLSNYGTNA